MKTSLSQSASKSVTTEIVSLAIDADALETITAAIQSGSEVATALLLVSDNHDAG